MNFLRSMFSSKPAVTPLWVKYRDIIREQPMPRLLIDGIDEWSGIEFFRWHTGLSWRFTVFGKNNSPLQSSYQVLQSYAQLRQVHHYLASGEAYDTGREILYYHEAEQMVTLTIAFMWSGGGGTDIIAQFTVAQIQSLLKEMSLELENNTTA